MSWRAPWLFLPVIGAYVVHAPILRFDALASLKCPLDGGVTFRGRRLLGDNKTWRGALAMFAGVLGATLALSRVPSYWRQLPAEIQRAGPVVFGIALALGVVLGELPNSFMKRQLDIAPGSRKRSFVGVVMTIFDQGDFVVGVWLLVAPIWCMPVAQAALSFAVVVTAHMFINVIGRAIGARKEWL